jgi:hypothetical protein
MSGHWYDPDHHGTRRSLSGDLPYLPPCNAEEDSGRSRGRAWEWVALAVAVAFGVAVLATIVVLAGRSG